MIHFGKRSSHRHGKIRFFHSFSSTRNVNPTTGQHYGKTHHYISINPDLSPTGLSHPHHNTQTPWLPLRSPHKRRLEEPFLGSGFTSIGFSKRLDPLRQHKLSITRQANRRLFLVGLVNIPSEVIELMWCLKNLLSQVHLLLLTLYPYLNTLNSF